MPYDGVPRSLRDTARWCCWGYRNRDGRQTKIPFNPRTGAKARSNDPSTFGRFQEAVSAAERMPEKYYGIGVGLFGDLVGIDIDHCAGKNGELSDLAQEIIEKMGSYAERSPSGTGLHIYCRAPDFRPDKDRYYTKNPENGVEIYVAGSTNRYLTVTGDAINGEGLNERSAELAEVMERFMRRRNTVPEVRCSPITGSSTPSADDPLDTVLEDAETIDRMLKSKSGENIAALWAGEWQEKYTSQSEADLALCNYLAFWTRKDPEQMDRLFRQSALYREEKWDRQQSGTTYGAITVQKAISECATVWTPGYRAVEPGGQQAALDFLKASDVAHSTRYTHDDMGAGYLLADYLKPFARYVPEKKGWRVYDGLCWRTDTGGKTIEAAAKDMSRALAAYASTLDDKDMAEYLSWAGRWSKAANRKTYIYEATSVWPVSESCFDRNPWLLNLNNGTLSLKTMELRDHDPDDLITQLAPVDYDPATTCPRWDRFVREIMEPGDTECPGDKATVLTEKAVFLQTYLGYCISGDTSAEAFLILYGATSRNGKSVCVETVQSILGSYSRTMNADTLMVAKFRDGSSPSEDIARLAGVRMVSVGEIQQGSKLDASRIKTLTGGDTVTARFLGENSFEFTPRFKLLLHTNHLPQCSDLSVFDSGRALVLPFSRHFEEEEQDKGLKRLFREPENQSAILNWLIEGLREYLAHGLHAPAAVKAATAEYRRDSDKVARFMEERLRQGPGLEDRVTHIYAAYKLWCQANGQYAESSHQFRRKLLGMGMQFVKKRPSSTEGATEMLMGYALTGEWDDLPTAG